MSNGEKAAVSTQRRSGRVAAIVIVLLFVVLTAVYTARVELINETFDFVLPEYGLTVSIGKLDTALFRRSLTIYDLSVKYEDEYALTIKQIGIKGLNYPEEDSFSLREISLSDLSVIQLNSQEKTPLLQSEKIIVNKILLVLDGALDVGGVTISKPKVFQSRGPDENLAVDMDRIQLSNIHFGLVDNDLSVAALNADEAEIYRMKASEKELLFSSNQIHIETVDYSMDGAFSVAKVGVSDSQAPLADLQRLVKWQQLDVEGIAGDKDVEEIVVASVNLEGLIFDKDTQSETLGETQPIVSLNGVKIDKIKLTQLSNLLIDRAVVSGGDLDVLRDADGNLNLLPPTEEMPDSAEKETGLTQPEVSEDVELSSAVEGEDDVDVVDPQSEDMKAKPVADVLAENGSNSENLAANVDEENETAFLFNLQSLVFSAPMNIAVKDQSVDPHVDFNLVIAALDVKSLHNHKQGEPTEVSFSGSMGEYSVFEGSGAALLDTASDTFTLAFKLSDLELPHVTGYSQMATGYEIGSGQLDFDLNLAAEKRELGGTAVIDIHQLVMAPANEELVNQMNQQLTMPLPTALYVLEDGDERIHLEIPMKGDMDSPSFSWNSIFRILTMRALKEASYYYVKNTLFPGNLLIGAATFLGGYTYDKLTELPPLQFQEKELLLLPEHLQLLDNVGTLLKEKKKLTMKICSYGVAADGADKKGALLVAKQRSDVIRQYLVSKEIESPRLYKCLEHIDNEAEKPYVKLIM